jgi:hypothetical protein
MKTYTHEIDIRERTHISGVELVVTQPPIPLYFFDIVN